MPHPLATYKSKLHDLKYIIFRNVFFLTNGIIFSVVVLLFVFGNFHAGLFLGIITVGNMAYGLTQDIHSWWALEKLQLLTAPRVIRVKADGSEELVLTEAIKKGDRIKLKIGDQVPCDSTLLDAQGLEVNEGLITGESNSMSRAVGQELLAGSVVTAGAGSIRINKVFNESRIARMTEGVRKYSVNSSPIQQSVSKVITYSGYALLAALVFVVARGFFVPSSAVAIVLTIGTLTSILVPQGLVFAVTLFFAYGAADLFKRHVLLQEVNATEKLGRIKNLCMDKTGTLTENTLVVENAYFFSTDQEAEAKAFAAAYLQGTNDASQIISAAKKHLGCTSVAVVRELFPFSSWRRYGAVCVTHNEQESVILAGSPEVFLESHVSDAEKQWLTALVNSHTSQGKHVLCLARSDTKTLPTDLRSTTLSIVTLVVFQNNLRPGIQETITFFQDRGVRIRIITGDNPETARAVALQTGIKQSDAIVTGTELESWTPADFLAKAKLYSIFARIVPEQKAQIIAALKKDGFTAMIGDGANDALAIKIADVGIAMFDGAPATRQVAAVVLTNNSFAALPGGVELADRIIRNIEVFGSIFFNQTLLAFFFFLFVSICGYNYPLTPFNVTLINYFAVGIPGLLIGYWAVYPAGQVQPPSSESFLKRVLPFAAASAVIQAVGTAIIFALSPTYLKTTQSNTVVLLAFIIFGFVFFIFAPRVYYGVGTRARKIQLALCGLLELVLLIIAFHTRLVTTFFDITTLTISATSVAEMLSVVGVCCIVEYFLAKYFVKRVKN